MKTPLMILSALLLAACGKSDAPGDAVQNAAQNAPKPMFTAKYINGGAIAGLDLGAGREGTDAEGKKQTVYPITGLSDADTVRLTGGNPDDLEAVSGKCMETDGNDSPSGWSENGICRTLFAKLAGNIAQDGDKLTDYLVSHAALSPYQAGKSGYAAVQNGRYILELDSEGVFTFRRRHY